MPDYTSRIALQHVYALWIRRRLSGKRCIQSNIYRRHYATLSFTAHWLSLLTFNVLLIKLDQILYISFTDA